MNFYMYIIFVTVYSFGAFRSIIAADLVSSFQLADDSPQKIEQMKQAAEEILNQVMYRYSLVEPARLKAIEKKDAFESVTKTEFTQTKPREGKEAQKLWKEAKTAADKYATAQKPFQSEKFCIPPLSNNICERAFKNPYFRDEKLTLDESTIGEDEGCIFAVYSLHDEETNLDYRMIYKTCLAKRKNDDETESLVNVYLQTAYKQPLLGAWKFFVVFKYIKNTETEQWERPSDIKDIDERTYTYRYEAYLSLT